MRKGCMVKFDLAKLEQEAASTDPNNVFLRSDDSPATELLKRVREDNDVTAEVTGTIDGGEYLNLIFEDGFECGVSESNVLKA